MQRPPATTNTLLGLVNLDVQALVALFCAQDVTLGSPASPLDATEDDGFVVVRIDPPPSSAAAALYCEQAAATVPMSCFTRRSLDSNAPLVKSLGAELAGNAAAAASGSAIRASKASTSWLGHVDGVVRERLAKDCRPAVHVVKHM